GVVVTGGPTSFTATATVAPLTTGIATVTVFAHDEYGVGTNSFMITVTATNYPPTLAPIADQTTPENTSVVIPLSVTDPDTAITNLTYGATWSPQGLVSAVTFAFVNGVPVATVKPATDQFGTNTVTISVGDGATTVSQSFKLTVPPPTGHPVIAI